MTTKLNQFIETVKAEPNGKAAQHFDYLLATKGRGWGAEFGHVCGKDSQLTFY